MTTRCQLGAVVVLWILVSETAFGFYDPQQGRWMSREPLGESGSINLYSYCANNPVNFFDPDGRIVMRVVDMTGRLMEGHVQKEITAGGLLASTRINEEAAHLFSALQRDPPLQMNPLERSLRRYQWDTSFRPGYSKDQTWEYNGRAFLGREVNYLGQGMYGAAMGQSWEEVQNTIMNWKNWGYWMSASEGDFYWAYRGYSLYKELLQKKKNCN